MGHIEREEIEIDFYGYRRYHCSTPAITETDVLIRYDNKDGLKQDPCNEQSGEYANCGKDEAIVWNLADRSGFEDRLHESREGGSKDHQRYENDKQEKHSESHNILRYNVSRTCMVNEIKIVFD